MGDTQTYNFLTPSNYTFDANAEVTGGYGQLTRLLLTSTCAADYSTSINLSAGGGVLTGTAVGGAAVSDGKLDLTGGIVKYVQYAATGNVSPATQVGCVRFKYIPNYNTGPATETYMFSILKATGDYKNAIFLKHTVGDAMGGALILFVYNSSRVAVINDKNFGAWKPILGTEYEFELNWDLTTGATRLFINGVQKGATATETGVRNTDVGFFRVGTGVPATAKAYFKINDIIVFSTVQHTANYTPDENVYWYDKTNPGILCNEPVWLDALEGFTATEVKAGSDEIKYLIKRSTEWVYWNGTAWVVSDQTYAQATTAVDVETNKASFTTEAVICYFKPLLHSDTGYTTLKIDTLVITFSYAGPGPDTIDKCIVYGYSVDPDGSVDQTIVKAALNLGNVKYKDNVNIVSEDITDTPDSTNGYWELELIETENMDADAFYIFTLDGRRYKAEIPAGVATCAFWELPPEIL